MFLVHARDTCVTYYIVIKGQDVIDPHYFIAEQAFILGQSSSTLLYINLYKALFG